MASIPDNFIEDLIARIDLRDLIGRYITLKKVGSRFMGVCPFHGDKNPSLSVTPDKGFWYCFGCQEGGDAISFIRKKENLDFVEAVRFLARMYGMPVPEVQEDPHATRRQTLYDINESARELFCKILKSKHGRSFREYLKRRGFSRETILTYKVGASLPTWDFVSKKLIEKGYKPEDLVEAGVSIERKGGEGVYDRFRGRLMIPIIDTAGQTLGFGGRAMGSDEPKYINSPESRIFRKGRVLFGLNLARGACKDTGCLVVMEGYTDVMQAHQAGIKNCCAVMGTALTEEHIPRISGFADEVVLAFDGDEAGRRAALRSLMALAGAKFGVRVLELPMGSDPADMIAQEGAERFVELLQEAGVGSDWAFRTYAEPVRKLGLREKLTAFEQVAPYILAHGPGPIRDDLMERAAVAFNLNLSALSGVLRQVEEGRRSTSRSTDAGTLEAVVQGGEQIERVLFLSLLAHPQYLPDVRNLLNPQDFFNPLHRRLARLLLEPGFALGTPDGLSRIPEVYEDEDLMSLVVRLAVELDESGEGAGGSRYTELELRRSLLCIIRRQYEEQCKSLQAVMADLGPQADGGNDEERCAELQRLSQRRQELEERFRRIEAHLESGHPPASAS